MYVDKASADDKFRWDKGDYCKLRKFLDINWDDFLDWMSLMRLLMKCGRSLRWLC